MNEDEADRDLRRVFTSYAPPIAAQPFLEQALAGVNRQIRRERIQTALLYVLSAIFIAAVAAATAVPLSAAIATFNKHLDSMTGSLSPTLTQVLIYAATLGLIALGRRRLRAFLEPW